MSDAIIGRIDEMGSRIDELEKSIADLMEQVRLSKTSYEFLFSFSSQNKNACGAFRRQTKRQTNRVMRQKTKESSSKTTWMRKELQWQIHLVCFLYTTLCTQKFLFPILLRCLVIHFRPLVYFPNASELKHKRRHLQNRI